MTWPLRPVDWDAPGHLDRADEREAILDRIEATPEAQFAYKLADESVSSATTGATYQNDDHLSGFVVAANSVHVVELDINATIGAGGLNTQFTFPSGTAESAKFGWNNGTVTFASSLTRVAASASPLVVGGFTGGAAGGAPIRITFTLFVGSTGGALDWQWAQSSSNAALTTISKGSWMRATLVG